MADISDICAYLEQQAAAIVYPNGTTQPSISGHDIRIFQGWPIAEQLDRDMSGTVLVAGQAVARPGGPVANVSIYPLPGATATPYQILDHTYTIVNPNYGLAAPSVSGNVITVSGTPVAGEYLTVILNRVDVLSSSQSTLAAILSDLASQATGKGYTATATATTLTISGWFDMVVRQGSVGTLARVTHRQKQAIMVTIWAPDPPTRTTLAAAVDVGLKLKNVVTLPDTSEALICYSRTTLVDTYENVTVYRRDLIFDAEYATLEQFPGYVITSHTYQIQGGNWGSPDSPAITNPPIVTTDP
jgi:hypothetical protein